MKRTSFIIAVIIASAYISFGQIKERQRPAEWDSLVEGGKFMDRILPMPEGKTAKNIWGTSLVQNRFVDNGIERSDMSYWGGNILKGEDGKYHLFITGWFEHSPKGHMFWPNSSVYHAVSDKLNGPFKVVNSIGKGHNAEAFFLDDGRVVVYVIDGYYIADNINSLEWTYGKFLFDPRGRKIIEGLSNLTFARRQDGSRLMVCRGGGIWISQDGLSKYEQLSCKRVYPDVEGCFEDPVVWRDSLQYHLIVNDWLGRIAFYERSMDGLHWVVEQGEAYVPGVARHVDGYKEDWFKYERAKIYQDDKGRACQINFAVIDTLKGEDKPNDRHSSKNICLPLNKGLIMEVLNTEPITDKTKKIELRVELEDDLELDVESLRFGSYNEVNFGRGSKVIKQRTDGNNLILTFDGRGSGINAGEWAPKLIGKTKQGSMVFGYAKLPYVDYTPAIVSSLRPEIDSVAKTVVLKIKNYGLKDSEPTTIHLSSDLETFEEKELKSLKPYQECTITFPYSSLVKTKNWKVTIGNNTEQFN